jgi:hypothetical protein
VRKLLLGPIGPSCTGEPHEVETCRGQEGTSLTAARGTEDVLVEARNCCKAFGDRTVSGPGHVWLDAHGHLRGGEEERPFEHD